MRLSRRLRKIEERVRATAPEPMGPLTLVELVTHDRPAFRAVLDRTKLFDALPPHQFERHPDAVQRLACFVERWQKFEAAGRPKDGLSDQEEALRAIPPIDWTLDGVPIDRWAKWRNPCPTTVKSAGGSAAPPDNARAVG